MKNEPVLILLVEDEPAHAEIVLRKMRASQFANRVIHVRDGQSALDYLMRQGKYSNPADSPRPNLVLLDLRLPKVDGLEVLRQVKADTNLRKIPVVVLTTSCADGDLTRAYTNHANSYLVKPVDFGKFMDLLREMENYWMGTNQFPPLSFDKQETRG